MVAQSLQLRRYRRTVAQAGEQSRHVDVLRAGGRRGVRPVIGEGRQPGGAGQPERFEYPELRRVHGERGERGAQALGPLPQRTLKPYRCRSPARRCCRQSPTGEAADGQPRNGGRRDQCEARRAKIPPTPPAKVTPLGSVTVSVAPSRFASVSGERLEASVVPATATVKVSVSRQRLTFEVATPPNACAGHGVRTARSTKATASDEKRPAMQAW